MTSRWRTSMRRRARRSPISTTRRSRSGRGSQSRCGRTTPTRTRTARSCSPQRRSCCERGGPTMTHGVDGTDVPGLPVVEPIRHLGALGALDRAMAGVNRLMLFVGMVTLVVASLVLTYSVFSRYLFKAATDWQDEVAVFSIVGCVFLCGAWGHSRRCRGGTGVR